ncbi:succinylglutamate desuccinylase, partial [Coprococcus eutactus]|nr:succinylglutamate desuccinylase [Coprococcus eutactus]
AGFFINLVEPGEEVGRGDIISNIIIAMTGENTTDIFAPTDGIIFFCEISPIIYQNSVIFKMIRWLDN